MKQNLQKINKSKNGFVLLFAVIFSGIILAVSLGVANIAFKEISFSTSAKSSNDSFLAADIGVECALLNDKTNSASFKVPSPATISCMGASPALAYSKVGVVDSWTFVIPPGTGGLGQNFCSKVKVEKDASRPPYVRTTITSKGYNLGDCTSPDPKSIERELVVSYGGSPDNVWMEDALPSGATASLGGDSFNWVTSDPVPFSGSKANKSTLFGGRHQQYFDNATSPLSVNTSDIMIAYVYLDPVNPPSEIMLQWYVGGSWEHRAYWGPDPSVQASQIGWGTVGTDSLRYRGSLPVADQWVRLAVPASTVGLQQGAQVTGMAFTLYGGQATWDHAGKNP